MYTEASKIVMLAHGTAWQSDISMACQVLASQLASTRLKNLHRLGSDASIASRVAAKTQHRLKYSAAASEDSSQHSPGL